MSKYPEAYSKVTVTFTDGEVKEFIISAGPSISTYLAREAADTGILCLFNHDSSFSIPTEGMRYWHIEATEKPEESEK